MRKKVVGIYIIENTLRGKVYVGQSVDVSKRLTTHMGTLRKGAHINPHLQSSFNKYGEGAFRFYLVHECLVDELDHYEIELICSTNSIDHDSGYNMRGGGDALHSHSEETKLKISESSLGRTLSPESRELISVARKGKSQSEEHVSNKARSRRRSGSGISKNKCGTFKVKIEIRKERIHLGTHKTYEEALEARLDAEECLWV